jgi:hypothetical protein
MRRGSRRIPGRRHGWRRAQRPRSAHESTCGFRRWQGTFRGQGYDAFSLPLCDNARGSRSRRGRGGAGRSNAAAASYARGKGPRSNLAPGIDARTCWGAWWRGASGPRGDVGERERERLGAALWTRAARLGVQQQQGEARPRERARVDEGSGTCKRVVPAWHEGRHHQRRRGATTRSTSARRPGHPHGEGSGRPHLGGHGP